MIWHTVYQSKRLKIAPPFFIFSIKPQFESRRESNWNPKESELNQILRFPKIHTPSGYNSIQCNIQYCNTISKEIYCFKSLCYLCLHEQYVLNSSSLSCCVALEWKSQMAENRLHTIQK